MPRIVALPKSVSALWVVIQARERDAPKKEGRFQTFDAGAASLFRYRQDCFYRANRSSQCQSVTFFRVSKAALLLSRAVLFFLEHHDDANLADRGRILSEAEG